MGCEAKLASLKIEQASGNNYMGAVTPNGTRLAYAARFATRLFVPMLALGKRCQLAHRPSWMTPALPGIHLPFTLNSDHFAVFVEKDGKVRRSATDH